MPMQLLLKNIFAIILFLAVQNDASDNGTTYIPKNLCIRLVTNHTALLQWVEPVTLRSEIRGYTVYYARDAELPLDDWTKLKIGNNPMVTISSIELGQIYHFRVQVDTLGLDQSGPISDLYDFRMLNKTRSCYDQPNTSAIKSLNILRAAATSYSSVEVWWNFKYDPHYVTGFQIFYGTNDSEHWLNRTVGPLQSVELSNLKESATYKIALAAVTTSGLEYYSQETTVKVKPEEVPLDVKVYDITAHSMYLEWSKPTRLNPVKYKIAYDAIKDFVDSSGIRQHYQIEKAEKFVDSDTTFYELEDLIPYTNYNINISAIPVDYSYRPSIKITAKTEMAAPGPMSKPEFYGIINGGNIKVILPQASEEYGPINYYYIIVVPKSEGEIDLPSSVYATKELLENEWDEGEEVNAPYIAAKFSSKIPYAFLLGGGGEQGGFKNHKLSTRKRYRIFVRAFVITPQGDLFTDSPYSDYFSLSMPRVNKPKLRLN